MNQRIYGETKYFLNRIFKNNKSRLNAIINELDTSMKSRSITNLTTSYLKNCFDFNSIIVAWNGTEDRRILLRLGFTNHIILNLTAYDEYNNHTFYLKLINFNTKEILIIHKLGYVKKNGRLLSLLETHNLICEHNHNILCEHEPVSDVRLTKCIFDYMLKRNQINNFIHKIVP